MAELYFLRHGKRIDHALAEDPSATPLITEYQAYDPSLASSAVAQINEVANDIASSTEAFDADPSSAGSRKNIFIHFSPYLRCCQSADMLVTDLKALLLKKFPHYKVRFQLLGDFALSEWIHDRMRDKPPFVDSNDAYNMYTPNLRVLKNKSACSNFRPTNTLGPFNGPDLSYKDYQARCKAYFQKLMATYDKPTYMKNKDIIIVISHGYVINNFISYFINHPIFDEIPEAKINFAKRILKEEESPEPEPESGTQSEDFSPDHYTWKLLKDSLDLFVNSDVDTTLNLENDIVYYQTNFIKRDELNNHEPPELRLPQFEKPRPSFKIESTKDNHNNPNIIRNYNPLCPAAKDWTPQQTKHFLIKTAFKLKVMNDESFKKSFSLDSHPSKPISPEVSPNSEPTRNNSVIDLTKLVDNDDIYKPMKLKYSTASEVPIHRLNSKVNSQVNLAQSLRTGYGSSNDSSSVDLPKFISNMANRKRSLSNPTAVPVLHNAKDSYFPSSLVSKVKSLGSDYSLDSSNTGDNDDLHIIKEHQNEPLQLNGSHRSSSNVKSQAATHSPTPPPVPVPAPLVGELNRSRSLNYNRTNSKSLLAKYQKAHQQNDSDESDDNMQNRLFSFSLNNNGNGNNSNSHHHISKLGHHNTHADEHRKNHSGATSPPVNRNRSRKNSIKFIPSFNTEHRSSPVPSTSPDTNVEAARSVSGNTSRVDKKSIFYHLNSDDSISNSETESSDGEDEESSRGSSGDRSGSKSKKNEQYIWFGQNRN